MNEYDFSIMTAARAAPAERATFLKRTYAHLLAAVLAFVAVSAALYSVGVSEAMTRWITGSGSLGWLAILGGFMLISWLSTALTAQRGSIGVQYFGLGLMVFVEALIFAPLLFIAHVYAPGVLPMAAFWTLFIFAGLTILVFATGQDFSFLKGFLMVGALVAIGTIVLGALFGWELGVWFSAAMILFASLAILYDTSKVLHRYPTDMHVAAALDLFTSVALLFWYVLRLLLAARR
jgi:FtsH-binding integral membrane protein